MFYITCCDSQRVILRLDGSYGFLIFNNINKNHINHIIITHLGIVRSRQQNMFVRHPLNSDYFYDFD